jgi:hypothetical protein
MTTTYHTGMQKTANDSYICYGAAERGFGMFSSFRFYDRYDYDGSRFVWGLRFDLSKYLRNPKIMALGVCFLIGDADSTTLVIEAG